MAKTKAEPAKEKEPQEPKKTKEPKESKAKEKKDKDDKALVGRIKKVVKKSRRKLSEDKFEKQLQRTITFLEEIQSKLSKSQKKKS